MKRYTLLAFCLLGLASPSLALETIPEPVGLINDGARVFKHPQALEARLVQLEKDTGAEMAVVTRPALPKDEGLEAYSTRLFNQWGLGKKHSNNGLLFLLAFKERKMRLEVGSGLKSRLSDAQAQAILDQAVKPKFKTQDFDGGLVAALDRIETQLKHTSLEDLEAGVATYAEKDDKAWIWGLGVLGASALAGLFMFYWLLRFVFGVFRGVGKAVGGATSRKSSHSDRTRSGDGGEIYPAASLLNTSTSDDDTWRSSFSSDSGSSSSYDSFGGGSSDGGGASSDW